MHFFPTAEKGGGGVFTFLLSFVFYSTQFTLLFLLIFVMNYIQVF